MVSNYRLFIQKESFAKRLLKDVVTPRGSVKKLVGSLCRTRAKLDRKKLGIADVPKIKDIDILIVVPSDDDLGKVSLRRPHRVISKGVRRMSVVIDRHSIDIFIAVKHELPFALLHYTSPAQYNIRLRAYAKKMGYRLNQYGLFRGTHVLNHKFKSQSAIQKFLGVTLRDLTQR